MSLAGNAFRLYIAQYSSEHYWTFYGRIHFPGQFGADHYDIVWENSFSWTRLVPTITILYGRIHFRGLAFAPSLGYCMGEFIFVGVFWKGRVPICKGCGID